MRKCDIDAAIAGLNIRFQGKSESACRGAVTAADQGDVAADTAVQRAAASIDCGIDVDHAAAVERCPGVRRIRFENDVAASRGKRCIDVDIVAGLRHKARADGRQVDRVRDRDVVGRLQNDRSIRRCERRGGNGRRSARAGEEVVCPGGIGHPSGSDDKIRRIEQPSANASSGSTGIDAAQNVQPPTGSFDETTIAA